MAYSQPSSSPLFASLDDIQAELTVDDGTQAILNHPGANQFLGEQAARRDDFSTLGPRGNKVQDGMLSLINQSSPLGGPNKANPAGSQTN